MRTIGPTKLNTVDHGSDVMDVTMDVVAAASGSAELPCNGKRSIDDISDNASDANSSNKKACLPRRVSTIPGDGSTCTEAIGASSASASTIVPTSTSIVAEPRRPMIRRVSEYLDDVRRSRLLMVGGQAGAGKGDTRNRRRTDGTATPGLVTPSSSFLVGSIEPTIAAILEEEEKEINLETRGDTSGQCEECQIVEKEASIDDKDNGVAVQIAQKKVSAADTNNAEPETRKEPGDAVQIAPKKVAAADKIDAETKTQMRRPRSSKSFLLRRVLPLLILIEAALLVAERVFDLPFGIDPTFSLHEAPIHPDSVYVPGAGFSGYWFTLGRLKSIPDPASKSYYCYSAGCLGVVATLADKSMQEMSDLAFGVQRKWKEGALDRYDVVSHFVDGLLFDSGIKNATAPIMSDANLLSKINVITSSKAIMGVRSVIRTPQSIDELRDMLLHTTWIPWATGDGLWVEDVLTGNHHMDGAFSATTHPRCSHHLGLPFMLDLFLNILNVNLGRDKVEKYWNAGVLLGI